MGHRPHQVPVRVELHDVVRCAPGHVQHVVGVTRDAHGTRQATASELGHEALRRVELHHQPVEGAGYVEVSRRVEGDTVGAGQIAASHRPQLRAGKIEDDDATLEADTPGSNFGGDAECVIDNAGPHAHCVMKFPNIFGTGIEDSHYGSVDASLWFARAVLLYDRAGGDEQLVLGTFLPKLREIAAAYRDGTAPAVRALGIRADEDGITLFTVHVRRGSPDVQDPKLHVHSKLNCILACIQATKAGANEALMLDPHGFVSTCNSTNFFIVRDNQVWTSTGKYCLNGITRGNIISLCKRNGIEVFEKDFQ